MASRLCIDKELLSFPWMLPCCWQSRGEAISEKGIFDSIEDYMKRALMSDAEPTAVKSF